MRTACSTALCGLPVPLIAALFAAAFALAAYSYPAASPASEPDAAEPLPAGLATYVLDRDHTEVGFRVRHLGISDVSGQFSHYDATLEMDPARLATLRTTATIRAASVDTRNERRDEHLRSDDFFAAEAFPTLTFRRTGVRNVRGDRFELLGDLTIRGVTRPVVLDAELVGTASGPMGDERVALSAVTRINRFDYGLAWNRAVEAGGLVVAREVEIRLDVQAVRQP
jgi:polyisoprenoid-binding protein YceI